MEKYREKFNPKPMLIEGIPFTINANKENEEEFEITIKFLNNSVYLYPKIEYWNEATEIEKTNYIKDALVESINENIYETLEYLITSYSAEVFKK